MGCINSCFKIKEHGKLILPDDTIGVWTPELGTSHQILTYESYLFDFNNKTIERVFPETTIEFSNFALHGMRTTYEYIKKNYKHLINSYYVVCPVYCEHKRLLDTQFSITGTCYKGEDEMLTAKREIAEEIGVTVFKQNSIQLMLNHTTPKRTETSFLVDISKERAFDPKLDVISEGKDDKSRKIQVVIIGELNNLKRIYSTVYDRPPSDDLQTIRHVRFISLKEFF